MEQYSNQWEHHCLKCDYKYRSSILHSPCRKCRRYRHRMVTGRLAPFDEPQTYSLKTWKWIVKEFRARPWYFRERPYGTIFSSYFTSASDPCGMYIGVHI